jgi:hypothetical protein
VVDKNLKTAYILSWELQMQNSAEYDFKEKVRETVFEMFEKESERLYPLLMEIMEDIALARAMEEGEKTGEVTEDKILGLLSE